MRIVLRCIVMILDYIMLTPRFTNCEVTISTIFLDFAWYCTFLYPFSHLGLQED